MKSSIHLFTIHLTCTLTILQEPLEDFLVSQDDDEKSQDPNDYHGRRRILQDML